MKRWIWFIGMVPIMYGLLHAVVAADCLYAWQYDHEAAPPTEADRVRAATVFWGSLLTPLALGLVAATAGFRRGGRARWPLGELCIVGTPILILLASLVVPAWINSVPAERIIWPVLFYGSLPVGGAMVLALHSAGTGLRHRRWGPLAGSVLVSGLGGLYLFWLYGFIIYIDT